MYNRNWISAGMNLLRNDSINFNLLVYFGILAQVLYIFIYLYICSHRTWVQRDRVSIDSLISEGNCDYIPRDQCSMSMTRYLFSFNPRSYSVYIL